jgi:hypothetical protein
MDGYRLYYDNLRPNVAISEKVLAKTNQKAEWIFLYLATPYPIEENMLKGTLGHEMKQSKVK